jgi:hypothetical protein
LQGFNLKNCKSLAKTNRVLEQAHTLKKITAKAQKAKKG